MHVPEFPSRIEVIDSHTAGEPTRCVLSGGPDLGSGSLSDRLAHFRRHFDAYRRAILCEPRGSDVLVGALLVEPSDPACTAGVIFFNNAGFLGMCGHGMIGVVVTLAHLRKISPGEHRIETPVGIVDITLHPDKRVTVRNVPSYRLHRDLAVDVPGYGEVAGDVAWGGNWFFLVRRHSFPTAHQLHIANVEPLTAFTWAIRQALNRAGITGANGSEIDHIELFADPESAANDSRNFVLCPGKAYDRSPCGTGTSAKIACLAADATLKASHPWRQEGILGTVFEGNFEFEADANAPASAPAAHELRIRPSITGSAYVTAEGTLLFDPADPFRLGVPE
ncbi:proline racemase family protein [Occallatibacter savannae]|uniref:proline racemase family protein n=1 Tax=Occallatibacter savannae TaxID=1002691 RepID=UPI000D689AC5|nr:proline racemase family protein [Occallatibacter savannae]